MFVGEKVRLRAYTREDLVIAREYLNDFDVAKGLRTNIPFPLRAEDEEKWYESLDANGAENYGFAIESKSEGQYLGGCGVHQVDGKNRKCFVGIFVGKPHWNLGYGADALRTLVRFCFDEINLNKVTLNVYAFNASAIRCYEKVGFTTEATLRQELFRQGRYHDAHLMAILRSEWEALNERRQGA